jgi:hypothetical protein
MATHIYEFGGFDNGSICGFAYGKCFSTKGVNGAVGIGTGIYMKQVYTLHRTYG